MADIKCRGFAGSVPVYCSHDEIVPIADVKPNPKNPNQHPENQIEMLAKIITTQGWRAPVTVSTFSGLVVRGHGRLMAAKFAGLEFVPVDFQNYESNDAELADLLADNKIAELSDIDNKMLADLFADIDTSSLDIDLTGYTEDEYKGIMDALTTATSAPDLKDPDAEVAPPKVATTKAGDIWRLGKHRLMCGDSTSREDVETLMGSEKADMVFTDPPYGYQYQSNMRTKSHKFDVLKNDDKILDFMPAMMPFVDGFVFVCTTWKTLDKWLPLFGNYFTLTNMLIWDKGGGGIGDLKHTFSTDYEIILCSNNGHELKGKRIGSVWNISKDNASEYVHATQKPVALMEMAINSVTKSGNVVLDVFGGSGSTLIACEKTGRSSRLMELDPKYCDVIVRRYMQVTGKRDVVLVRDGEEISVTDTGILTE